MPRSSLHPVAADTRAQAHARTRTQIMERWWLSHVEELVPLVNARLAARAVAAKGAAHSPLQPHPSEGPGEDDGSSAEPASPLRTLTPPPAPPPAEQHDAGTTTE